MFQRRVAQALGRDLENLISDQFSVNLDGCSGRFDPAHLPRPAAAPLNQIGSQFRVTQDFLQARYHY